MTKRSMPALLGPAIGILVASAMAVGPAKGGTCDALSGKTMRLVVPNAPGGGIDMLARQLEPHVERLTGAQVVVDNVEGAGGRIGTKAVRDAVPDGLTIGIVSGSTLFFADVIGEPGDPVIDDFLLIGQLDEDPRVFLVAASSPIRTVEDLWNREADQRLAIGVSGLGTMIGGLGLTEILALDADVVPLPTGSQEMNLALLRGDIDLVSRSSESAEPLITSGEMRPILVLADRAVEGEPAIAGVPLLGGPDGVAVRRAATAGMTADEATERASSLNAAANASRIMVAPAGLSPQLQACMDWLFTAIADDPSFLAEATASGRALSFSSAADVTPGIARARASAAWLKPIADRARSR